MAIDPNNPPVNSRVNATMRVDSSALPTAPVSGSLNLCWLENGTDSQDLHGLYMSVNYDTYGGPLWTYVGGYGIYMTANNYLMFGKSAAQTVSEVVVVGTNVNDGGDGGVSIRIGNGASKRIFWANYDGQAIVGADDELNAIQGGQRSSVEEVDDDDYAVVDGTAVVAYIDISAMTTRTVTLPAVAASQQGRIIVVKDAIGLCSATEVVRVVVSGGATIQGSANVDITTAFGMRSFLCTSVGWVILGSI